MYLLERTGEPMRDLRKHLTRHYLGGALPLAGEVGTLGALTIYATKADAFDTQELEILKAFLNIF